MLSKISWDFKFTALRLHFSMADPLLAVECSFLLGTGAQRQFTKDLGFRGVGRADALPRLHLGSSLVGSRGGDAERLVQRG